jgi:ankyrin repeat protein
MAAATQNKKEVVRTLLEAGAKPNLYLNGFSAEDYARHHGNEEIADLIAQAATAPLPPTHKNLI